MSNHRVPMKSYKTVLKTAAILIAGAGLIVTAVSVPVPKDSDLNLEILGAAASGDCGRIQDLLDHGANIDGTVSIGLRAVTPLTAAVAGGNAEAVRLLLASGADVNAPDSDCCTPLHHACWNGRADLVLLLLEAGADPNPSDVTGLRPLELVRKLGRPDLEGLLLEAGAHA